jgi:hypothetical protein
MNTIMEKMLRQKASETVNFQKLSPRQKQILEDGMVRSYQPERLRELQEMHAEGFEKGLPARLRITVPTLQH